MGALSAVMREAMPLTETIVAVGAFSEMIRAVTISLAYVRWYGGGD